MRAIRIILSIAVLLWVVFAVTITTAGKRFFAQRLAQATGRAAHVEKVAVSFPFTVIIDGLAVKDFLEIESVRISPDILASFSGRPVISELLLNRPKLNLNAFEHGSGSVPNAARLPFVVRQLIVKNAAVRFFDRSVGAHGMAFVFSGLTARIRAPHAGGRVDGTLETNLFIAENPRPCQVSVSGWLDWQQKDISAHLACRGLDAMDFHPYFAGRIDLAKAGFTKLGFDFSSDIWGAGNDVSAPCRVEFTEIAFLSEAKGEKPQEAEKLARTVFNALEEAGEGKAYVDFVLKAKLDRPQVDIGEAFGAALEEKIKNSIVVEKFKAENLGRLPVKLLTEALTSTAAVPKGLLDRTKQAGEDLKGMILDSFFRVKPKPQP